MLGFSPLASAPLGDLGDNVASLSGNNVITASPVVGEATLIQDGLFAGLSVVAQNPVVDAAAVSQNHSLSATYTGNGASVPNGTMFEDENFSAPNVITGTVRVDAGSLTQNEVLSGSDVTASNPSISSTGLTETNVFGLSDINSGAPSIGSTAISQLHNIASADVNSDIPTLSSVLPQVTFTVTVVGGNPSDHPYYNVGSTNKYAINGSTATADVALELIEGHTYKFDQSDSSNNNHPLRFSTTANGAHSSGTEYTDGVSYTGYAGSSGGCTIITVPFGAPTLYYYCSNHSNMGWSATTVANTSIAISQLHNLTSNNVTSGAINVPQGAFTQNHSFALSDITSGNVQIDTTTCIFSFDFASPDITFGNLVIDTSGISQIHNMGLVYTGQPADVPNLTVFEDETFSAPDVLTGSVRVASAVLNQNHALTSNNVETQQPSISNPAISINHVLLSNDVTSNAPIIDNAIYGVEFLSDSVTTQAPTVAQTVISQIHNTSGQFIHSGVSVATTAITQIHFLTSDNVISQNVDVQNTKNPWDITTDTDNDNYNEILPPSEAWSNDIVAPSPIFTDTPTITPFNIHAEPTSTKTDSFQSITNDISTYKNTKGRFYFSHEIISGTGTQFFRADLQLDNITIGNTYFSMQVTNGWQTSIEHFNNFTDVTDWVDIPQSNGSVSGRWNRRSGSTPSNNTGIATSSNAYYFYTEATSTRYGYKFWLRSPVIELNDNPILTYLLGRRGSSIGEFKIIYGREQVLFAEETLNTSTWTDAA